MKSKLIYLVLISVFIVACDEAGEVELPNNIVSVKAEVNPALFEELKGLEEVGTPVDLNSIECVGDMTPEMACLMARVTIKSLCASDGFSLVWNGNITYDEPAEGEQSQGIAEMILTHDSSKGECQEDRRQHLMMDFQSLFPQTENQLRPGAILTLKIYNGTRADDNMARELSFEIAHDGLLIPMGRCTTVQAD